MGKYIAIDTETGKKLEKAFGVSRMTIWKALHYVSDSNTSQHIRHMAKMNGGEVRMDLPEVETLHSHDGVMTQTFGNGVVLKANVKTGVVTLHHKGMETNRYMNVLLSDLGEIQRYAASMR